MTTAQITESKFLPALAEFEKCLVMPVVSGELPAWLRAARDACDVVRKQFRRETDKPHEKLLRDMVQQDPDLATRAQKMKDADQQLLERLGGLAKTLDRLTEMAESAEPHEAKLDDHVNNFTDDALHFVTDSRKQESAFTTWYMEAFNRDRGIGD